MSVMARLAATASMSPASVRYPIVLLLFPAWLAVLFYLPTLGHGYVWDDTYFLSDLPYLRDPALWWQAVREPLFVSHNYFRPLPLLMFVAEAQLGNVGAFAFHLVNVLLHAVNTTLVVWLARGLLPSDRRGLWLASLAGLLFALHPAVVENVSWISDRFDLLMAFFILLALACERFLQRAAVRLGIQCLCLLGALLSKETGVVLLVLLPLWQIVLRLQSGDSLLAIGQRFVRWPSMRQYLSLCLVVLIYLGFRYAALGFLYQGDSQIAPGTFIQHLLLIGKTLGWYACLLLVPFLQVSPVHPAVTPIALSDGYAWLGLVMSGLLVAWIIRGVYRQHTWAGLILMALVALAPVANLLPLTIGDNLVHDRYLIMPIVFVALALTLCLYKSSHPLSQSFVFIWLLAAAVTVALTVPRWASNISLWEWAYDMHPTSKIASRNYLLALANAQRHTEVITLGAQLIAQDKRDPSLPQNMALAMMRKGDLAAAEIMIKSALDMPRKDDQHGRYGVSEALNLLAHIQMQQLRWTAAEANLMEAIRLTPHLPRPHYSLALVYYHRRRIAAGDDSLATALRYADAAHAEAFKRQATAVREQALATQ